MKYTFSEDEDEGDDYSDTASYARRSARNTGTNTPAEGPTITQSGRQVRSRHGGMYGETLTSETQTTEAPPGGFDGAGDYPDEDADIVGSRPRRAAAVNHGQNGYSAKGGRHIEGYNSVDDMDDEEDASEQDYGDDEEDGDVSLASDVEEPDDISEEDEDMEDELLDEALPKKKLVVKLPVKTPTPEKQRAVDDTVVVESKMAGPAEITSTERQPGAPPPSVLTNSAPSQAAEVENEVDEVTQTKASVPMDIAHPETIRGPFTPLSPSLAYRGSPEKPHGFSAVIDVTHSGQ